MSGRGTGVEVTGEERRRTEALIALLWTERCWSASETRDMRWGISGEGVCCCEEEEDGRGVMVKGGRSLLDKSNTGDLL